MHVLSLFDGISCAQLALHRAGLPVSSYLASEVEPASIACTMHNFPRTVQIGDVTNVRTLAELGVFGQGKIDLLIGGSPCQGFSLAGEGLNFSDPRSRLFFEFVRIKNAIKPKRFLLENVRMRQDWSDLISAMVGVKPITIDSSDFSAQSRKRQYWTDITVKKYSPLSVSLSDILLPGWYSERQKSYCVDAGYFKGTNFRRYFFKGSRQIVFRKGFRVPPMTKENANFVQTLCLNDWRKLEVIECERLQTIPDRYTANIRPNDAYKAIGNGYTVDVIAHILRGLHV